MKRISWEYDTRYYANFNSKLHQQLIGKAVTWNYSRLLKQPYYRMFLELKSPMNNLQIKLIRRCNHTFSLNRTAPTKI